MNRTNLLTLQEVAEELQVSVPSIRRWIYKGILPAVRLPRHLRVSSDDLERWLDERKGKGATA